MILILKGSVKTLCFQGELVVKQLRVMLKLNADFFSQYRHLADFYVKSFSESIFEAFLNLDINFSKETFLFEKLLDKIVKIMQFYFSFSEVTWHCRTVAHLLKSHSFVFIYFSFTG